MYIRVTEEIFINEFESKRPDNFSREGLRLLFNWLEEVEDDCNPGYELDVIGICCEYSELSIDEVISNYAIDIGDIDDKESIKDLVIEYLNEVTCVIGVHDNMVIFMNY